MARWESFEFEAHHAGDDTAHSHRAACFNPRVLFDGGHQSPQCARSIAPIHIEASPAALFPLLRALLLTVRSKEEARATEYSVSGDLHHVLADYHRSLGESHQQQYGITVSLLRCEPRDGLLRLTICSREKTPISATLETAIPSLFQHGHGRYEVQAIDLTNPRWAGISTWADLFPQQTERCMHFSFATPLITAEPDQQQNRTVLPFPEPLPLFSSLAQRWQMLGGPTLAGSADQLIQASASLNALTRLAFFTGTGYLTAYGLGSTTTRLSS